LNEIIKVLDVFLLNLAMLHNVELIESTTSGHFTIDGNVGRVVAHASYLREIEVELVNLGGVLIKLTRL
jgi:hypothetical protein